MKAIQPSNHKISKTFNHFFSLLRRFFSKLPALSYGAGIRREDVLGLYSYKTLWRRSGTFSAVALGLLILFTIFPLYIIYSTVEAATTSQSEPTITITASNATASLDLLVKDSSGTVASDGTPASFSVYTNNYTGYTLSIKSSSSSTDLTSNNGGSLTSISSSVSSADNISNGSWAYMPSKYNSVANTNYLPSPNSTGSTLAKTTAASTDSYTISIAAKADYSKVAGTYGNTYTLTAVVNGFNYRITYNKGNTTDTVTNLPSAQSANAVSSSSIKLRADTPVRSGYTFNGWCSVMPTTTGGSDSCSGDRYWTISMVSGPTYYFNKKINNTNITLYAMWEEVKVYMQDLNPSTIAALLPSVGSSTDVYDKRDDQKYAIAKLADGKYWMTKNMNLASGTKLESTKSDVPSGYTESSPYYTLPASSTSGFSSDTTAYVYNSNSTTCGSNSPCYSYYSWLAATAGGKDSSGNAVTTQGYNAEYSICPKGWKLPTSTTSNANAQSNNNWKTGDWYAFATAYGANLESNYYQSAATFYNNVNGGNAAGKAPVYLPLAGYYYSSSFFDGGSRGNYWSRTANSSANAYNLLFNSSYVASANSSNRRAGFSVRCIFDDKIYMQDIDSTDIANMTELEETTMYDKRDGSDYTVKKINGQLWMTQNLRLTGGSSTLALDSTLSNVSSYTMPAESTSNFTTSSYSTDGHTCSTDTSKGCWYNYYSASAGTISGNSNTTAATSDICPKNWHLPTGPSTASNTDFNKLVGNTTPGYQAPTTGLSAFGGVPAGYYYNGSPGNVGTNGYWWSTTAYNDYYRYFLSYRSSDGYFNGWGNYDRYFGLSVRCVHD